MKKFFALFLVTALGSTLVIAPSAQAKAKINKPSAPTIVSVTSTTPKKGKVNVIVTISLPASNGGSKITGTKISAGGKSCTIKKLKTSCTIKGLKNGKSISVIAKSKNKKGFGSKSTAISYVSGGANWSATPTPTPAPTPTPTPTPTAPESPLRIVTNTCTSTTSAENCLIEWELDEDWEWSVSRSSCVNADGGGAPQAGAIIFDLTGVARECFFTVIATNSVTGRVITRELPITIQGLYPIPIFTITTNTCTNAANLATCIINWSVDEDSEFSWGEACNEAIPRGESTLRGGSVEIDLTGGSGSCSFSIRATSLITGRTSRIEFVITRPDACLTQSNSQVKLLPLGC